MLLVAIGTQIRALKKQWRGTLGYSPSALERLLASGWRRGCNSRGGSLALGLLCIGDCEMFDVSNAARAICGLEGGYRSEGKTNAFGVS